MVAQALFLPLISAAFLFLAGPLLRKKEAAAIACVVPLFSFVLFLFSPFGETFGYFFFKDPPISFSLLFDPLSKIYALVITGVGFLIHLFSAGYMEHETDRKFSTYFGQLNFFIFSMLLLVLSDSLLFLFFGWELVGLCSYLLIGFWAHRQNPPQAARKAFLTNRLGDLFFIAAIALTFHLTGSVSFAEIFRATLSMDQKAIIALMLFVAATGKSAQIPLYIWLPDAMEGPTPVSALIHAATMVTAGIYLILRLFPLFDGTITMPVVAYIGAGTALYAALVASFQEELKKILAFSTISQLGLMFMGLGCGSYLFALFHFITHAFFKSLLFLATGAIMHQCHEEQHIFRLGGLHKKMPYVHLAFLCGVLALSGIFPFAGFFSKDGLLSSAFHASLRLYLLGQAASMLTAFYAFRMFFHTFYGEFQGKEEPREPGGIMKAPLVVLAILSLGGGILQLPTGVHPLADMVSPVLPTYHEEQGLIVPLLSQLFALSGVGLAFLHFTKRFAKISFFAQDGLQKYFYQPLYKLGNGLAQLVWMIADLLVIDGIVNAIGVLSQAAGNAVKQFVSGQIRAYLATFSLAMALFLLLLMLYG